MSEINQEDIIALNGKIDIINTNLSHLVENFKTLCHQIEKHEERIDEVEKKILIQEPYQDIVKTITRSLYATAGINAIIISLALWIVGGK